MAVLESDGITADEPAVVAAARAWLMHDEVGRQAALSTVLPLLRFPLLPRDQLLAVFDEPLLQKLMRSSDDGQALGGQLLKECVPSFAETAAAQGCRRLKRRLGNPKAIPVGVQLDYCLAEGGWETVIYDEPYEHDTNERLAELEQRCCGYEWLLVGARKVGGDHKKLALCAAAKPADVFRRTESKCQAVAANGAFWYHKDDYSMGFAPSSLVELGYADFTSSTYEGNIDLGDGNQRLSWTLASGKHFLGRAGLAFAFSGQAIHWRKVIMAK
eukprot:SAG11_NODE_6169_length_1372_cov_1.476826_1_plen_272_part_00